MASTQLIRTPSSASNRRTWTWSAWVKRGSLGSANQVLFEGIDGGYPEKIQFTSSDRIEYDHDIAGSDYTIYSDQRFKDVNGWYHIVVAKDTTQATETDRIKIYVNNEQVAMTEEALGYPGQNYEGAINKNVAHYIGGNNGGEYFNGSMSHVHFCDGSALAPTVFGETDSVTGEWKINTSPSFTPGTNGFTVLKDGNSVTDSSANSNNFTVSTGTLTKTEDCPSNVFATINLLDNFYNGLTITNGNTSWVSGSPYSVTRSTLGASSGKYYFEMKVVNEGNTDYEFGIVGAAGTSTSSWMGSSGSYGYSYESNAELRANGTTVDPWGSTYDDGDILGCAFDLDNNKIYFSKNGSWQESGNPSAGSNGYTIVAAADTPAGAYFVGAGDFSGSSGQSGQFNFGNGYFGTTAVSSAGSNASNNGIFEYDVPTGYTALSTKGLNL